MSLKEVLDIIPVKCKVFVACILYPRLRFIVDVIEHVGIV